MSLQLYQLEQVRLLFMKSIINEHIDWQGKSITVKCSDIDKYGNGIAKINKDIFIVPELVPGEIANVLVLYRKGSTWITKITAIKSTSGNRNNPPCKLAAECGGCSLQHISDYTQLTLKRNQLIQSLKRIANIDFIPNNFLKEKKNFIGYRNRTIIPIKKTTNGVIKFGYYKLSSHFIVDIDKCIVLDERINKFILPIKNDLDKFNCELDCDLEFNGGIRHICFRIGVYTNEVLITIISSKNIDKINDLSQLWMDRWNDVVGVTINYQPLKNNILFGSTTLVLQGRGYIVDILYKLKFQIGSSTFFQVNTIQAEIMIAYIINKIKDFINYNKIIDCYCGIGTITLPLAKLGYNVIGIEISNESIINANDNARINNIKTVEFVLGNVDKYIRKYLTSDDLLIIDPPRKGLSNKFKTLILETLPKYIIYISCHPGTLARDLKDIMINQDYIIESIQPFDFFPQTTHIECLCILYKVSS